jgi:hypothetical protein
MKNKIVHYVLVVMLGAGVFLLAASCDVASHSAEEYVKREYTWYDKTGHAVCFEIPDGQGVKKVLLTVTTDNSVGSFNFRQHGTAEHIPIAVGGNVNNGIYDINLTGGGADRCICKYKEEIYWQICVKSTEKYSLWIPSRISRFSGWIRLRDFHK